MSRLWRNLSDEEQAKLDDNSPTELVYDEEKEPSDSGEADGFDDRHFKGQHMEEFTDLDEYFACFLFSKGLDKPFIKLGGDLFKIPPAVINKAVIIAKHDKDFHAMKNACKAYSTAVME